MFCLIITAGLCCLLPVVFFTCFSKQFTYLSCFLPLLSITGQVFSLNKQAIPKKENCFYWQVLSRISGSSRFSNTIIFLMVIFRAFLIGADIQILSLI